MGDGEQPWPDGKLTFGVLGPLTARRGGARLELGSRKQRVVLAHLLLHAGRTVSRDELVGAVWPNNPPKSAHSNLQTYVWRLRRVLAGDHAADPVIEGAEGGYRMAPDAAELDADVVERWMAEAQRLEGAGRPADALAALREAGQLFRGSPLEDLPAPPGWDAWLSGLAELRLSVIEQRLSLQTALGQHDAVIVEAAALVAEQPFREAIWYQYVLALNSAGRRADALDAMRRAREVFVAELGVEPGPELRELHRAVLDGRRPQASLHAVAEGGQVPRQLPADPAHFVGRSTQLDEVTRLLAEPGRSGPPVVLITGSAGTGKSCLAVLAAHRMQERFPSGQLYAVLSDSGTARPPGEILSDLLLSLGVRHEVIPRCDEQRAAMFRSRMSGKRVLILLDDAHSAAQVRPLIPAEPGCAVIVTSRTALPDLPDRAVVGLRTLSPAESVRLIADIIGQERADAELSDVEQIASSCAHLPLALHMTASRLAANPAGSVAGMRRRLADESLRLNEIRVGELAIRPALELSVRPLPTLARRALCRAAAFGTGELPGWYFDALLGRADSVDVIEALTNANVLLPLPLRGSARTYRMHDLLRAYAAELRPAEDDEDPRTVVRRTLRWTLRMVLYAAAQLPSPFGVVPGPDSSAGPPEDSLRYSVPDPVQWLESARFVIQHSVGLAGRHGLSALGWQIASAALPYYELHGLYEDWRRTHEAALDLTVVVGDHVGEAVMRRNLGQLHVYRDEFDRATEQFSTAARLFTQLGDARGQAVALAGLGSVARFTGKPRLALRRYRSALRQVADDDDLAAPLQSAIGSSFALLGDTDRGRQWLTGALERAHRTRDRHREARVLTSLGDVHQMAGDVHDAVRCQRAALHMLEAMDDERCAAYALLGVARAQVALGDLPQAFGASERALRFFRRTGDGGAAQQAQSLMRQTDGS